MKSAHLTKLVLDRLPQYNSAADQSSAIKIGIAANATINPFTVPKGDSEFDRLLTPYFESPFEQVRASAIQSLSSSTRSDRTELLISAIFDESEMVQISAIRAARSQRTFSPEFTAEMKEILQDPRAGYMVRYMALGTLQHSRPNQQERELYQRMRVEIETLITDNSRQ